MTLYETVISNLKGVVGSNKEGISIYQINNEYEFITGTKFPLKDLGYDTIPSFLKSIPNLFRTQYIGSNLRVFNVIGNDEKESNLALYDMILNTYSKKTTKFKNKYPPPKRFPFSGSTGFQSGLSSFESPTYSNTNKNAHYISKNPYFDNSSLKTFENFQIQISNFKESGSEKHDKLLCNKEGLFLSDSDNDISVIHNHSTASVAVQTKGNKFKKVPESYLDMKPSDVVSMIIDIIVEFKPLNLDNIVYFKIGTDLYYYFNLLTGCNFDPNMFFDIVLNVLSSLKCVEMYEDLIYVDVTNKYCCLNLASTTCYTLIQLPQLEFNNSNSYRVHIVSPANSDGIVTVHFSEESSQLLKWSKIQPLTEQTKYIIENQRFWSWIPGSICLVQLPFTLVKSLKIESVERAVILSTEIARPTDVQQLKCSQLILHTTTFYLIDHKLTVPNVYSCNSSFQSVKRTAYRNNDTNIANVCNVSVRGRCMPSKTQFMRIININDVSHIMYNHDIFRHNCSLALDRIKRSNMVINFQPIYDCYAVVNKNELERERPIEKYADIETIKPESPTTLDVATVETVPVVSTVKTVPVVSTDEEVEIIEILDSDDERAQSAANNETATNPVKANDEKSNKSVLENNNPDTGHDNISVVSFHDDMPPFLDENNGTISVDSSVSENHLMVDNEKGKLPVTHDFNRKPEKCIIPISSDLCNKFERRIVKVLHLQSGAAVISVLESTALMKRQVIMDSLAHCQLNGVIDSISIGDFYLWCPKEQWDDYHSNDIVLVEILQVINADIAMVSLVHHGLLVTVKRNELYHVPNAGNPWVFDIRDLIGPLVGAFDMHMIPKWFSTVIENDLSDKLFTAYFVNDDELVLEYFDNPCQYLNIDLLSNVEQNLTTNHCNSRSKDFITSLSESLLTCRMFVGKLLLLSNMIINKELPCHRMSIVTTLIPVNKNDESGVWLASIDMENEHGEMIQKMSPHCFSEHKFCIDRVQLRKQENKISTLDYPIINVEVPEPLDGILKFDSTLLTSYMESSSEFYPRYMVVGLMTIPGINSLFNKLIF